MNWKLVSIGAVTFVLLIMGFTCCENTLKVMESKATMKVEHPPITIVTGGIDYTAFEQALKEAYPEIKLEFVSYAGEDASVYFEESLKAGDAPDIFTSIEMLDMEVQREYLVDLSNYDFAKNYRFSMLDETGIEKEVYMVPANMCFSGIFYNKTLMEKYGWKVPENFEEMKALIQKIKAAGLRTALVETEDACDAFGYFMNIAKTEFLHTPKGVKWQKEFLKGEAKTEGYLEETLSYVQGWIDCGLLQVSDDSADKLESRFCTDYEKKQEFAKGNTVFYFAAEENIESFIQCATGKEEQYGVMPWISEDGQSNLHISCVERYYGINKKLEASPDSVKFKDARTVLNFIFSEEGQRALAQGRSEGIIDYFREETLSANNPYYKGEEMLKSGYTVSDTYGDWENAMLPLGEKFLDLMCGTSTDKEFMAYMNEVQKSILEEEDVDGLADIDESLSLIQTGKIVAKAMAEEIGADVALISLGDYKQGLENPRGVNGRLYAGKVLQREIESILPKKENCEIVIFKLKGDRIKEIAEGGLDLFGDGDCFKYVCYINGFGQLDPDLEYTLVINEGDYEPKLEQEGNGIRTGVSLSTAVISFLEKEKYIYAENF